MTKRQAERYAYLVSSLGKLGFDHNEVDALLRCSKVLSTWAEHECNGVIQRDGENGDGRPYWWNPDTGKRLGRTADREAGAIRRAKALCEAHGVQFYHQGDPRGCALYVLRPGDVPDGASSHSCYSNGIAVCVD